MIRLYKKPDFYEEIINKEVNLALDKDRILGVCAYEVQNYMNKHYASNVLTEDLVQDVVMKVTSSIELYKPERGVPFWVYIRMQIKNAAKKSYQEVLSYFGESPDTHRTAKKVQQLIEEEHLSIEEAAKRTSHKTETVHRYQTVTSPVNSLDATNKEGYSLYDQISKRDKEITKENERLKRFEPVLAELSEEERYIINTYIRFMGEKDFRKRTENECKKRGISGRKVTMTIREFKEKCKNRNL